MSNVAVELRFDKLATRFESIRVSKLSAKFTHRKLREEIQSVIVKLKDKADSLERDIAKIPTNVNLDTARSIVGGRADTQTLDITHLWSSHKKYV